MFFHINLDKNIILEARHFGRNMREVLHEKLKNEVRAFMPIARFLPPAKKTRTRSIPLDGDERGGSFFVERCASARVVQLPRRSVHLPTDTREKIKASPSNSLASLSHRPVIILRLPPQL